jgi:hypothetical protein
METMWAPKKPGSQVQVQWQAPYPWGPWHLAKPDKRSVHFRRPIAAVISSGESKGVVGRY